MKLLLLSCSTGEGHNSAARALLEAAEKRGWQAVLRDPVSFQSEHAKDMVAYLYNRTIQIAPKLFGAVYHIGSAYSATGIPSPIYAANTTYIGALHEYMQKERFDAVICTHLYAMEAMTALRRRGVTVPAFAVLTDYILHPFMRETRLDGYFLPHEDLKGSVLRQGLPEEKLFFCGIPTASKFAERPDRAAARAALNLPEERKVYLFMTGGVGGSNLTKMVKELLRRVGNEDFTVFVLTGKDASLLEEVEAHFGGDARIRPVPFTPQVPLYMAAADVLISKPGGLSVTETMVAGVPTVHMLSVPGCETANAKFFRERGMSLVARSPRDAVDLACDLAADPAARDAMREAQKQYARPHAANDILKVVETYV